MAWSNSVAYGAGADGPVVRMNTEADPGFVTLATDHGTITAPCVADLAGDGTMYLLVGQFGEGKLRVYRNAGTKAEPRFDKFSWFRAGGVDAKVPSG